VHTWHHPFHRKVGHTAAAGPRTSSTLMLDFALVSKNLMPNSLASAWPLLYGTARLLSSMSHLLPTRICARAAIWKACQRSKPTHGSQNLRPHPHQATQARGQCGPTIVPGLPARTRTLFTEDDAWVSMFFIQFRMLLNDASSVTSYTSRMPIAPR